MNLNQNWESEFFISSASSYFAALIESLKAAKQSIDLSFYIFDMDSVGEKIVHELKKAQARGVHVRVLVDGIGTNEWSSDLLKSIQETDIELSVYNPLPWPFSRFFFHQIFKPLDFLRSFVKLNERNHKKLALIDSKEAFVGGINLSESELDWEDFAIRVTGEDIGKLQRSFNDDWENSFLTKDIKNFRNQHRLLFWTQNWIEKIKSREVFFQRLGESQRIWMTTGYFVPPGKLSAYLEKVARSKKDVRIVISAKSDFRALTWVSQMYFQKLIKAGVKIYLHPSRFIHAKCTLLDREAFIGSSNLNHRSYLQDSELDVIASKKETCAEIEKVFMQLMKRSTLLETVDSKFPWYQQLAARFLIIFKGWI